MLFVDMSMFGFLIIKKIYILCFS